MSLIIAWMDERLIELGLLCTFSSFVGCVLSRLYCKSCLSGLPSGTFVHSMNRLSLLHIASQHVLFGSVFARSICTYVYQLTDMYQVI